jgi:site-specific DNA recombinase
MAGNQLVAIYARVSTSNQENEGTIETQLSAVNNYIYENGFITVNKYIDEGWSGDNIVRPALDQLRVDAKKKIWETVVIYDPDRLARRYSYQELIMDELKEAGIEVLFVTTPAPKNGVEKILYGVQGLFSEYERAKIAERFRLGKVRKAKEGHIIATEAPYGYNFILKHGKRGDIDFKQGHYVINEYESSVVKEIFSWIYYEKLSLRQVVIKLKELGIKPRKSKRGVWNTSTLSTLVRNKTYIGEGHFGATYAVVPSDPKRREGYKKNKKTSRRVKPENEWIKIPTPRIIEDELFYKAVNRLRQNFELSSRNTKNEYLLAGRIYCNCGQKRGGEGPQKGKHLYYRCTDRVKSFPLPQKCKEKGLNARITDELVWNKITDLMSSPELMKTQLVRWHDNEQKSNNSPQINETISKNEIAEINVQIERYVKAYSVGAITLEALKDFTSPLKERVFHLKNMLSNAKHEKMEQQPKVEPTLEELQVFAHKAAQTLNSLSFTSKKAIVESIIEKVIGTKNELQVYGYIPIKNSNVFTSDRYPWGIIRQLKSDDESQRIPFEIRINMTPPQNLFGNPDPVKKVA